MTKEDDEDFEKSTKYWILANAYVDGELNFGNSSKCWILANAYVDGELKEEIIVISLENIEALQIEIAITKLN